MLNHMTALGLLSGVSCLPVLEQVRGQVGTGSTPAILKSLRFPDLSSFNLTVLTPVWRYGPLALQTTSLPTHLQNSVLQTVLRDCSSPLSICPEE